MADTYIRKNMRLFGIPYQFMQEVDPRYPTVSSSIGRKFAENVILDAPVITIIPGKPKYLPKIPIEQQFMAATSGDFNGVMSTLAKEAKLDEVRYYDFEKSYVEYTQYVNILCRTCAAFLEISEKIDGISFQRYDWSKYKWDTDSEKGLTGISKLFNASTWTSLANTYGVTKDEVNVTETRITDNPTSNQFLYETTSGSTEGQYSAEDLLSSYTYVQFFVDVDASASDSMSNTTAESQMKGMFDGGSSLMKEIGFVMNSGGIDATKYADFAQSSAAWFNDNILSKVSTAFSRVLTLASNVMRGDNVIMPDIYQSSSNDGSYTFTVHLRSPYGTKFGYFMNIAVPLMHLIALAIPKQTTANTYGSPFLVKAYIDGVYSCNMGIVTSLQITKCGGDTAITVDGLPTEVDVSLTITDLYSDLSMSPQSSPALFLQNTSLIDYLSVTCGLSLVSPNLKAKYNMYSNAFINAFNDIGGNVIGMVEEGLSKVVSSWFGLRL